MRNRYAEINFWFGYIVQTLVDAEYLGFAVQLAEPHNRKKSEPMGTHDEGWPPGELEDYTFRSPEAYGIPRMLTQYAGLVPENKQERLLEALDFLDEAIAEARNTADIGVHFAEKVVMAVADAGQRKEAALLLRHLVSNGKYNEDHSTSAFLRIFHAMSTQTPRLWAFYNSLNAGERIEYRILDQQVVF